MRYVGAVPDLADSEYRDLANFRFQLRRFIAFSDEAARDVGLEPRQHQLLLAVRGLPRDREPSVQVLAERMVLKHHTVVEHLDRLERKGLVRRTRDAGDRRRALIALTPRASQLLRKLSRSHVDELRSLAPELVGSLRRLVRSAS